MTHERVPKRSLAIRTATDEDALACLTIYAPYITDSAASFETDTPTEHEFANRIEQSNSAHRWLVATEQDQVLGYAYGTPHRARDAYRYSVEVSIYLGPNSQGRGVGRQLYTRLLEDLVQLGYRQAYAGITLPNDASVALHRATGFEPIGVFPRVGFKFGEWHDVSWWHRQL